MTRTIRLLTALVVALVTTSSPLLTAHASPTRTEAQRRYDQCRYGSVDGRANVYDVHEVDLTIACAVKHFPAQGGLAAANCIAHAESGDYWRAYNPSGASGIFQFIPSTWKGVYASHVGLVRHWHLQPNVFSARSNAILAVFTAHIVGAWRTTWTHPECGV